MPPAVAASAHRKQYRSPSRTAQHRAIARDVVSQSATVDDELPTLQLLRTRGSGGDRHRWRRVDRAEVIVGVLKQQPPRALQATAERVLRFAARALEESLHRASFVVVQRGRGLDPESDRVVWTPAGYEAVRVVQAAHRRLREVVATTMSHIHSRLLLLAGLLLLLLRQHGGKMSNATVRHGGRRCGAWRRRAERTPQASSS